LKALALVDEHKTQDIVDSWSPEQEQILKIWAEKAAGYRWLHEKAGRHYRRLNNKLTYPQIILSTMAGVGGFGISSADSEIMMYLGYCIAMINIMTALLISFQKFIMAAEKSENHTAISRQFASFYRNITLELSLNPKNRSNCLELCNACKDRYDRLMNIAPNVPEKIILQFKSQFPNAKYKPDVANGLSDMQIWEKTQETKCEDAFIRMRAFYTFLYNTKSRRRVSKILLPPVTGSRKNLEPLSIITQ
tara:strand:+ start:1313 stop:2059 length:747 start_codon:yes stop_codon:yes gene_type:complete